jgi:hypothetical protein
VYVHTPIGDILVRGGDMYSLAVDQFVALHPPKDYTKMDKKAKFIVVHADRESKSTPQVV